MPSIFFTADTHFGHNNIIRYCNRPFPSHEEMDEAILSCFNEVLRPGDILYHLGDVAFSTFNVQEQFLNRLRTKEVHLVLGNHDQESRSKRLSFKSVNQLKNISVLGSSICLCHYPLRSWPGKGRGQYQLYGHCHGNLPGDGRQLDVGVDTHNFYPWAWEEIKALLEPIEFKIYD